MKNEIKKSLDLHGVECPMNFIKTKLELYQLKSGEVIEVILDQGDPIENVPLNLEQEGHQILKIEPLGETYRVLVRKA